MGNVLIVKSEPLVYTLRLILRYVIGSGPWL